MAKSCKEGTAADWIRSGSEGHRFKAWCQQGLFCCKISVKIYPSLYNWYTQYHLVREMYWVTVHLLYLIDIKHELNK